MVLGAYHPRDWSTREALGPSAQNPSPGRRGRFPDLSELLPGGPLAHSAPPGDLDGPLEDPGPDPGWGGLLQLRSRLI